MQDTNPAVTRFLCKSLLCQAYDQIDCYFVVHSASDFLRGVFYRCVKVALNDFPHVTFLGKGKLDSVKTEKMTFLTAVRKWFAWKECAGNVFRLCARPFLIGKPFRGKWKLELFRNKKAPEHFLKMCSCRFEAHYQCGTKVVSRSDRWQISTEFSTCGRQLFSPYAWIHALSSSAQFLRAVWEFSSSTEVPAHISGWWLQTGGLSAPLRCVSV